jgi:hypothetical protein
MGGSEQMPTRDANGRFLPGQSGNPAGKKPGTRNRATTLREALKDGEDAAAARIVIDKALSGDAVAARFIVDRLMPRPRSRTIELDLPAGAGAADILAASNATIAAMAAGEITPDEALTVTRVLDGRLRALKAAARESLSPVHTPVHRKEPSPSNRKEPSPFGRGQGEGVSRGLAGAGDRSSNSPHPGPLPEGEGEVSRENEYLIPRPPCIPPAFCRRPPPRGQGREDGMRPRDRYLTVGACGFSSHAGTGRFLPRRNSGLNSFD